jgi:hypothetical protein
MSFQTFFFAFLWSCALNQVLHMLRILKIIKYIQYLEPISIDRREDEQQ